MTLLAPKEFPFSYFDNGSLNNLIFQTQLNTDPGEGIPPQASVSVKPEPTATALEVATYVPQVNSLTPTIGLDGNPVASPGLVSELVGNPNLQSTVNDSVRSAAAEFLGDSSSAISIDSILSTNSAATEGTAPQSPPQGGAPPAQNQSQSESGSGGELRYPLKKGDKEDNVMFEAFEYDAQKEDSAGSPQGMCILSIQPSISDSNTVGWGDGRVNALQLKVFEVAKNAIGQGFKNAATLAGEELTKIFNDTNFAADFGIYAASQAAQVNDAFVRETGKILNPNLELLFQGPELRSFNFNFQLSARSSEEAKNIKKIIRFFKKNMAVRRGDSDIYLKSPNIFKITYSQKESLHKFKTCALRAFNVDYTPLGTYMTFEDGTMVSYNISMQFQELLPIIGDDDYDSENEIGY